jgi:capsular exopolysaccharide synthesis family protein
MSTLLIGSQKLEDCIKHSSLENLDYITAGPIPPNPSELILSDKMTELLEELKSRYDYVVIDNPPSGLVSDSIINMVRADYPIYVIRSNYSRKFFINNLNQIAKENKLKNLTYVLNGFDVKKGGGYGYGYNYGYGGYNSYGYGYGGYGSYGNYGGGYGYTGGSYGYYEDEKSGIPLMFKILKDLNIKK